ncbi:MAG: tetratricopeptide repeat protein [Candidatus Aminicenantes bacterium]|jgi:tetratricopeptide (TPR) repeat protein
MKPTLMKYNPAFLSQEELIQSFVVRQVDLDLIIETIKENTGNSNQHILVIGPRGMGKTMLVLRAMAYIANDNKLNSQWYPIVFSEESYEVFTAAEFWLRAIFHLGNQTKDENLMQVHEGLKEERDEKRLYERALACLLDFADQHNKRLLLVVENINMLLEDQIGTDETWDIRHTLLNETRIMLLGTAPSRFDEIDNAGKAMFDLFKIHQLEPLSTKDSKLLWEYLTGQEVEENKIRPIQILTGGNPRLMAIISSFAAGASFRELMKQLTFLIDEYTTYFKSNIESLPSLERKVFVTLANIWEPAEAARVGRDARIDVNKTSSLLKRLETRGCVSITKSSGRKKIYQVTERLYNIYHLMRISGIQSDRVRAVVDFMVNFYEEKELAKKVSQLTNEAYLLDPEERSDHLEAYKRLFQAKYKGSDFKKIFIATYPEFLTIPDIQKFFSEINTNYQSLEEPLKKRLDTNLINYDEKLIEFIQKYLSEHPKSPILWIVYGIFLEKKSQKLYEAENAYRKAIEINPQEVEAWAHLGQLFHNKLERYEEAEAAYRKAIEIDPKYAWAWAHLGLLLHEKSERYEEAEKAYRKAIEIDTNFDGAWGQLIKLQIERSVPLNNIIDTISRCLKIFKRSADILHDMAWLIFENDFKAGFFTAEKLAKEALEKEPYPAYQHTFASILGGQGKWDKALSVAAEFLKYPTSAKEFPNYIISFFTDAAIAGYAKEGLKILKNSACAPYMEPLIVALQMLTGEDYNAPLEVVEVAKDVLKKIEKKKKEK